MTWEDIVPKCEVNTFYSQKPSSTALKAHSRGQMPQWGQELLMLYREPPPWSNVETPPITKVPPKTRSSQELAAIRRTDERAMKSVQKIHNMLSERHRVAKTEINNSCDDLKESARPSASRNPFAKSHSRGSSEHGNERVNDKTVSSHTHAVAKSIMEVPPTSVRSLKPITAFPIPRPPKSARSGQANKGQGFKDVLPRPLFDQESGQKQVSVSLQTNDSEGQKAEMMAALAAIRRGATERADLVKNFAMGRKRPRA